MLTVCQVCAIMIAIDMDKLTLQQELFAKLYTTKGDTFRNATLSYAEAYDYDLPRDEKGKIIVGSKDYNDCSSHGSRLFRNDEIKKKIRDNFLLLLNDLDMDARVAEIAQSDNEANALQAVKIHNDLKQRITKKIDITTQGRPLANLSDEELERLAQ